MAAAVPATGTSPTPFWRCSKGCCCCRCCVPFPPLQTFSCINPLMTLAALAYYIVALITESYNNIYVFRRYGSSTQAIRLKPLPS